MAILPTLRQLGYLTKLAEVRHFGRAADACNVTQSTLSAGIMELESLLDAALVERTRRKVMLTPLGEQVVARAHEVLRGAEDIAELARAAKEPLCTPVRLGVIPTIAPYLLPTALARVRGAYPRLRLVLREDLTDRLLAGLAAGDLDAALIALPWTTEGLETIDLGEDPFLLASPAEEADALDHPDDVAPERLLLLEEGHCLRQHALAACRLGGAPSTQDLRATSLLTLVQMVAGGMGVTLLPKMAVDAGLLRGTGVTARPLRGVAPARTIAMAWRRSSPRGPEMRTLAAFFALGQGGD